MPPPLLPSDRDALARAIMAGERRALARAITLIESTKPEDRVEADALLSVLSSHTGRALRLGITGVPGVGKSTFIEALGGFLIEQGLRVAVLAIDPSSPRSGGSILGDKTRMARLAADDRAFIRPSPSQGGLGGVARRTQEALLLCEAAGYDVIIVETVGVGQSEIAVADMTDTFLLLLAPGGGDDLQGIKKGVVELADAIIVTKADGDLEPAARRIAQDYKSALRLLRSDQGWTPPVITCSVVAGHGIAETWRIVRDHRSFLEQDNRLSRKRAEQNRVRMWRAIEEGLMRHLQDRAAIMEMARRLEEQVTKGALSPSFAARAVIDALFADDSRDCS